MQLFVRSSVIAFGRNGQCLHPFPLLHYKLGPCPTTPLYLYVAFTFPPIISRYPAQQYAHTRRSRTQFHRHNVSQERLVLRSLPFHVLLGFHVPKFVIFPTQISRLTSNPDKFPSSAAFDEINNALNASEADRKDAMKQGNAVFAFTLKNAAGETQSWHIDLKNKGAVGTGVGEKPTGAFARFPQDPEQQALLTCPTAVTLSLSESDFGSLVAGKANAQRLFMSGKLKIKGDVMKATKLDPILKKAQTKAKL